MATAAIALPAVRTAIDAFNTPTTFSPTVHCRECGGKIGRDPTLWTYRAYAARVVRVVKLPVKLHRGGLRRRAALAQVGVAVSVAAALGVSSLQSAGSAAADQVASARQQVAAAQAQ